MLNKIKWAVKRNKDDLITYGLLAILGLLLASILAGAILLGHYYSSISPKKAHVPEQPVVSNMEIPVVITSIDKRHWYASTHHWTLRMTVKNEEYGLEKSFDFSASGGFAVVPFWNNNTGDVLTANMKIYTIESSGEVVSRDISKILE